MNKALGILFIAIAGCCSAYGYDINLFLSGSQCTALGGGSVELSDLWRSTGLKYSYSDTHTEGPKIGNTCHSTTGWVCEGPQKMYVQYQTWGSQGCMTCDETWTVINDITYDTVTNARVGPDYQRDGPNCY